MKMLQLEAYNGYPPAQLHLGNTYRYGYDRGIGTEKDKQQALKHYHIAAYGMTTMLYELARRYEDRNGVQQCHRRAVHELAREYLGGWIKISVIYDGRIITFYLC